jgi:uncharacterized Ntn-hydrolase superfamily protein
MTNTGKFPSGLAAADALDELLSKDDFEPEVEVDTVALDATLDAITGAKHLLVRLERLARHLAAAGDPATAEGLAVEVRLTIERLDAITAGTLA